MGVLDSLLPIFLIIGLGAVLTARGFLTTDSLRQLNRVAYWVAMPAMLFSSVWSAPLANGVRPLRITLVILIATAVSMIIAFAVARAQRLPAENIGTFVQSAFRGNLAFVGLPLIVYAFNRVDAPAPLAEIKPLVAVAIAPVMILYNVLAVLVLVASQRSNGTTTGGRERLAGMLRSIATNPLVLAVIAGLVASAVSLQLPRFLTSTIDAIGGLAVPAALLGVGGTSVSARGSAHNTPSLVAALIKVAVTPLIALGAAHLLGLPPLDTGLAVVLAATPTAAASFIMATQLGGHAGMAASSIMYSTILSMLSLAAALALFH